jgi:hypothetical protein
MIKISVSILVTLLIGLAIAVPMLQRGSPAPDNNSLELLANKLDVLEQTLQSELEQRKLLQRQIEQERQQRMALAGQLSELNAQDDALSATLDNQAFSAPNPMTRTDSHQDGIDMLIEAGFDQMDAQRIIELETDLQRQIFSSRFGTRRMNPRELFLEMNQTLRSELGDEKYERYLETIGSPTSVNVGQVLPDSAGASAGLQIGDNIISYDGERVFSISDLQQATQTGSEGQTVVMEVVRDGLPVTLVLPRGTIGISAGGFDFRRREPETN